LEYYGKEKGMEVVAITKEELEEVNDSDVPSHGVEE